MTNNDDEGELTPEHCNTINNVHKKMIEAVAENIPLYGNRNLNLFMTCTSIAQTIHSLAYNFDVDDAEFLEEISLQIKANQGNFSKEKATCLIYDSNRKKIYEGKLN